MIHMAMDQALLGNIIEVAISLLNSFEHTEVSVVQREANIVAHRVARHSQYVRDLIAWMEEAPFFVRQQLILDVKV